MREQSFITGDECQGGNSHLLLGMNVSEGTVIYYWGWGYQRKNGHNFLFLSLVHEGLQKESREGGVIQGSTIRRNMVRVMTVRMNMVIKVANMYDVVI